VKFNKISACPWSSVVTNDPMLGLGMGMPYSAKVTGI